MKTRLVWFACFFIIESLQAQNFTFTQKTLHQIQGGNFENAWAGGLNSPQISPIDLNQDGTDDLFIYDRANQKIYTFLARPAEKKYRYTPEYEKFFPDFEDAGWVLLHDYNFDGKKDIFAGYNFGVQAYLNVSAYQPTFQKTYDLLMTESSNIAFPYNLAIFSTDIPAFYDVDNDGDLDALFLDFHNGLIELHLNRSKERYGNANFLEFERINYCWGDFLINELNCDDIVFDVACPFNNLRTSDGRQKVLHTGSAVLLADLNNDNLLDIMLSGVSCDKTYVMLNQGTNKGAIFRSFTTNFPHNKPIDIAIFAALYSFDVTFDGKKDLMVCSNLKEDENGNADFANSVWLYENKNTNSLPDWHFVQKNFLQNTMLDVGQDSAPAFIDYDGDGDLDMFVGNSFYTATTIPASKQKFATIHFYRNQGTLEKANFVLEDADFLSLSQKKFIQIVPQWVDINQDASLDLVFSALESETQKNIVYFLPNQAPRNNAVQLNENFIPFPLAIERGDKIYFYDIEQDGDLDVILAKPLGNLVFVENWKGNFIERNKNFLQTTISATARNPSISIADFDQDGKDDLALATDEGKLKFLSNLREIYQNSSVNWQNLFLETELSSKRWGKNLILASADLNADRKPDVIIGSLAGGVQILQNENPNAVSTTEPAFWLMPNPAKKYVYIRTTQAGEVVFFNSIGQKIAESKVSAIAQEVAFRVENWANGIYFVHFIPQSGEKKIAKFLKFD
ncbi:FG-GAP-like repeat-containing protein [Raineya sp.]|jgi:hypothetical protein